MPAGNHPEIVGLVPAAGLATRLGRLPCSKEIYPVGFRGQPAGQGARPKVVGQYLLEKMRLAGARKAFVVLREGKWDIPAYFGDGHGLDIHLAYLMMRLPFGVPYTLDQAYPFVREAVVLLGFPDLLFEPHDAFERMLERRAMTDADVVLGLFPTDRSGKMDMVELDGDGHVESIVIKPARTALRYTWAVAAWSPSFTRFMHEYLSDSDRGCATDLSASRELFVGDVIQAALTSGLAVESVLFSEGKCLDIGTPEDLVEVAGQNLSWRSL